ncbi:hypothetical protein EST38_g992 [Candolleomyces aberdarensis]|uniref:Uncharacterized protein n=1 Tax=Candolleomyces aberdarensis TaxID=2316362 RepID=A0A4V1Q5A7_9AGAR|nr:hypothetical protein EST38_g992 [Candolleomyces aberdarensis]
MDPADILRGVHLIPQFSFGTVDTILPKSRLVTPQKPEWKVYYINRFVDRDMFMRYQYGMSVVHVYMHALFPFPKLPSIPLDFDHCLQESSPQVDCGSERAQASSSNITITGQLSDSIISPQSSMDPPSSTTLEYVCPLGEAETSHDDDIRQEDMVENTDHDYLDDMDDREILVREEMYGEL